MSNKKGLLLAIGVVLLGLIITAGSYAFWSWNSNPNKSVAFNTSKALRNYIVYNEGESKFVGDFKVGSNYQDNSIHSTISLYKTEDAANLTLMATIHMDVNKIGENMKKSNALKWVVTKGNSTNPGEVLAQGNFVGTNNGDTLTLVPNIEVTTTNTEYTVWIWLDRNANPSDALSGETLDTNVWTEINQLEGVEDRFEITRLSANYQNINATVVDSKAKVTHYAVVAKGATPSTWTSVGTATNIYNLNTTVDATGEYDIYFKDEAGKTTHKTVTVTAIDNTAPTCTFDSWSVTPIANNETSDIVLTCTDNESEITVNNLKVTDITRTNNNITITNIKKSSISNGYKYTITAKGTETDGTSKLTLPTAKVKNAMALGNAEVSSATITVANKYTVVYQSGNNKCELNTTTYANKTATYGTAYSVANPTCTGYTFDGWTANSGLDTTNAKYGNSSSTVTTTWSNASTKVKATWFNNLALRTVKTVTLTANWTANDLTFNDQTLNTGTYGTAYTSNAFTGASNGTGSYTYAIKSGAPSGATLSNDRKISFTNTTDAGTYNVVITVTDTVNNKTKDATMKIVINPKAITITAKAQSITYGGSIATGTSQVTVATLASGDTLSAITLKPSTSNATTNGKITPSAATIKKGTTDVTSSYSITYVDGKLTIGVRTVTITAPKMSTATLTYNGSDQTISGSAGSCTAGGTMYYYTKNYTTTSAPSFSSTSSDWSTTFPTAKGKNATTYHLWYYCYVSDTTNNTGTGINTAKEVTKAIGKFTVSITLNPTTATSNYNVETSFTATPTVIDACKGTLTAASANTSYVTITGGASTANATSAVTVTWKGVAYTTDTKINVNYAVSDTTNCSNADQKQYTAKVNRVTPTVSLSAKTEAQRTYTGSAIAANTATATYDGSAVTLSYTYKYYTNSTCTTGETTTAPTNVGTYYVKAISTQTGAYSSASSSCVNHSIVQRIVSFTAPTMSSATLTYNGSDQTISGNAGSCTAGGTMYYYTKNYTTTSAPSFSSTSSDWSTTFPTAKGKNATTYHLWYYCYVSDTTNNTGTGINTVKEVTKAIGKKSLDITAYSTAWVNNATTYSRNGYATGVGSETINLTYTPYTNTIGTYLYATSAATGKFTLSQTNSNYSISSAGNLTLTDSVSPTVQDIAGGTTLKATSQTLTLKCTDNIGVTAYYWGTTNPNTADKITTTTAADLTALQGSGLTKTVTAAGTYYLGCKDAAGNIASKSIIIRKYQVQNVLETIAGTTETYTSENYENSGSAATYYVKDGTSLTLASIYSIPTGAASGTFKGYTTSAPGTSAANPSTTAPTVATNDTTVYYMWFNRNTYTVTASKPTNGTVKIETVTQASNSVTASTAAAELTVKYGDMVKATATPSVGYSFTSWSGGYLSGSTNPSTGAAVTAAKTITGTFAANTYTINYYQGNGTSTAGSTKIGSSTCTYGQSCTLTTYADLGSTFPISSASNTTSSNSCNHYWSFHSWTTSSTGGLDKAYDNGATFTYDNAGDLNLYAIGYRRFYFSTGQKPTSLGTGYAPYQYWNPYSTADAYRTSVDIPSGESISGWTFLGYGNDQANGTVIYNTSQVGTSLKPAYDACRWLRSKYSRTLTIQYQGNGSTSGSTSNTTATQYYNSGYVNNGANVEEAYSYPSFTLRANGFTKTGHVFSKWADGSTSGTKYNANASYSAWKPVIGDSTTKNMYAIWTAKSVTVIFNCNGNTSENNIFTYGSSSGKDGSGNTIEKKFTNTCSRTGYTFNKWQAPNGTNTWGQYSSVTDNWINDVYDHNTYGNTNSNITLTATWTDSTLPTGSVTGSVSGAKLSATVTATDTGSGIKASYGWKYSTSSTCNSSTTGFTDSTSNSYNFNLTSTGVYYVCVRIEDNAGNKNYVVSNAIAATYSSADFTFSNTGSGCKTVSCNSTMCTVTLKCTGTLTVAKKSKYQAFLVGGGGGGGTGSYACGGGGGYTTTTTKADMPVLKYYVTIGSGGAKDTDGTASNIKKTSSSGDTIATANGGKKGNKGSGYSTGGAGGSGGGFWNSSGGSNGSYGIGNNGGAGQKTTTRAFGESSGTLYAGGGSGQDYTTGGAGGGGAGGSPSNAYGSAGTANTGGGGGGGFNAGGAGGSGIVIFRFYNSDSAIPPTCKLTVSSSKVTLTYGSSVTSYGLVKGTTKNYNSTTSLSISAGTFTGFVKNSLGTEATCTTTVAATTTSTYKCCDSQGWYLINNGKECTFQMTQFAPSSDCTKVTCPSGYTEISGSTAYCYK